MAEMDCQTDRIEFVQEFMNTATSLYDHSNKGTPDYIESHKRSVFDIAASDMSLVNSRG